MKKVIMLAVLISLGTQYIATRPAISGEAGKANEAAVEAEKNAAKANRAAGLGNLEAAKKAEEAQVEAAKNAEKAEEHANKHH